MLRRIDIEDGYRVYLKRDKYSWLFPEGTESVVGELYCFINNPDQEAYFNAFIEGHYVEYLEFEFLDDLEWPKEITSYVFEEDNLKPLPVPVEKKGLFWTDHAPQFLWTLLFGILIAMMKLILEPYSQH